MFLTEAIHTEKAQCQDCYKCVRHCPVKAIKVENDVASVISSRCILCGTCVGICPVGAKKVRDDLGRARNLLRLKSRVLVSLAPSWASEFPDLNANRMVAGLKALGFAGISETALGAEEVSAHASELIKRHPDRLWISSACPAVVSYISGYRPDLIEAVTPLDSPLLAHCRFLRAGYGEDIGVVFIGPCIAKKREADEHPDLLNLALTFQDLRRWWQEDGVIPDQLVVRPEEDLFEPRAAESGRLYPIDGGMIASTCPGLGLYDPAVMSFSGMIKVKDALADLTGKDAFFLELLACLGGCINGPGSSRQDATARKRRLVIDASPRTAQVARPHLDIDHSWQPRPADGPEPDEDRIRQVLMKTGKAGVEAERNCGGCGYPNCRSFARAVLEGKAETRMCVTYMRQLASKKANRLIETMPSGVVIVDETLHILESNRHFIRIIGGDAPVIAQARPTLEGASLAKLISFSGLFSQVLQSGEDILERDIRTEKDAILRVSVFVIEPGHVVGGVVQDITQPSIRKEAIIEKARAVIHKNLTTVQQIAYLLGENASETEMSLNAIIDSFTAQKVGGRRKHEGPSSSGPRH